jgi:hypothetical protein
MARLTLNEHLFEVLENLTDTSVKGDELTDQIRRAGAASKIAQQILASQNFELKVALAALDCGIKIPEAQTKLKLLAR